MLTIMLTMSDDIVRKYRLPSNKIQLEHFNKLLNIHKHSELLLSSRLKTDDIKCNTCNKMKVNKAKNVFSHDVSCAFELLVEKNKKSDYICTAWFVKIVSTWFFLMTSRYSKIALGKKILMSITKILSF